MRRGLSAAVCLAVLATGIFTPGTGTARADWVPTKPIEFVVMAGKGGGADKIARFIAALVKKHNLFPVEARVVNMPAQSGSEALSYMKNNAGNDHLLMFTLNSFFTVPLSQPKLGVDVLTFTPVARLGLDPFLLWVHSDRADIDSVGEFAAAVAKADAWTMAGTGSMAEDELLTIFLNSALKLRMKYLPKGGGGEVARLLAEGSVQSTVNNPGEINAFYKARLVKPLAIFTRQRLPRYADTPTFWELGLEIEYLMQRGVAGPARMSSDAVDYYSAVFERVFNLPEWQDYRKSNGLTGEFLSGPSLREYWRSQLELHSWMLGVARSLQK
jgi:tripartite-type tricarboxylate transporter receptor subunit TctC